MSLDEYNDKIKALEANHAAMTQQLQRNYADLQAAQGNWVNGAASAFADYIDSARTSRARPTNCLVTPSPVWRMPSLPL